MTDTGPSAHVDKIVFDIKTRYHERSKWGYVIGYTPPPGTSNVISASAGANGFDTVSEASRAARKRADEIAKTLAYPVNYQYEVEI